MAQVDVPQVSLTGMFFLSEIQRQVYGEKGSKPPLLSPHPSWPCPICCVDGEMEAIESKGLVLDMVNMLANSELHKALHEKMRAHQINYRAKHFPSLSLRARKYVQKSHLIFLSFIQSTVSWNSREGRINHSSPIFIVSKRLPGSAP